MKRDMQVKMKGGEIYKMMKHYYTRTPTCAQNEVLVNYNLNNINLRFVQADVGRKLNKHINPQIDFFIRGLINENIDGSVLDVASGNGVVGIALSKFFNINMMMSDINMYSLELAERNACLNKIPQSMINTCESDAFTKIKNKYDVILLKQLSIAQKDTINNTYKSAEKFLSDGGKMYTVIDKNPDMVKVIENLKKIYCKCEIIDDNKKYVIVRCCKRKNRNKKDS